MNAYRMGQLAGMQKSALSTKQVRRMLRALKGKPLPNLPGLKELADVVRAGGSVGAPSMREARAQLRKAMTRGTGQLHPDRTAATGWQRMVTFNPKLSPDPIASGQMAALRGRISPPATFKELIDPNSWANKADPNVMWRGGSIDWLSRQPGADVWVARQPGPSMSYKGTGTVLKLRDTGARARAMNQKYYGNPMGGGSEFVVPKPGKAELLKNILKGWRYVGGQIPTPISAHSLEAWARSVGHPITR